MKRPEHREDPPEQVAAWLGTPDGEWWDQCRIGGPLQRHAEDSGVFADVIDGVPGQAARWPVPFIAWDLDKRG